MFSFPAPSVYQTPKCSVTYGTMVHPDPRQLPNKTKPWTALLTQDFVHKVDLIMPEEVSTLVKNKLVRDEAQRPVYHRVIMTLGQVLEGEFLTQYIKIGNIMMLSEGCVDSNDVFSIKDGTLTMYLEKETYERAGLVGEPCGAKSKRKLKPRWKVQYDLRGPSMLHGKKGFDRLLYACTNVFNKSVTWLFCNLSKTPNPDPLAQHFPTKYISTPEISDDTVASIPLLKPPSTITNIGDRMDLEEYSTEVYEWISLVRLESPRVHASDAIDPYLSRYAVPGNPEDSSPGKLCKISWQGFMAPTWTRHILASLIQELPSKVWFSISTTPLAQGFIGTSDDCTIMRPPNSPGEFFLWEIKRGR
ncbi:ribonuclease P 40kDa subunit [Xylariaceae sp. FL0016]|nr:ribonuclease P 40kDa subunit [Xylariaceae sp. FL0016]